MKEVKSIMLKDIVKADDGDEGADRGAKITSFFKK